MSIGNDFIVYVLRKSGANTYIHNGINKTFSFASKYRKELAIGGTITTLSVLSIYSIFRIYNLSSQLASAQTVQELLRTQFANKTLELAKNKMLQNFRKSASILKKVPLTILSLELRYEMGEVYFLLIRYLFKKLVEDSCLELSVKAVTSLVGGVEVGVHLAALQEPV